MSKTILIDVRTPAEFSTGSLSANNTAAVNIEYQTIHRLPLIFRKAGIDVEKSDPITLYCRSGRRSNIALETLRNIGYSNVRDIGSFDEAKELLRKEDELREDAKKDSPDAQVVVEVNDNGKSDERRRGFGSLVAGLKELE